ncbi:MAG: sarcosine oxidase subunit delta [Gammaproteobacteria bacterium]|nr:sarcosine oxidase subunit delta [Gammaproteobacteria bacterium]
MFLIECPWCGVRDESEFNCVGEAHIARPLEPEELSDAEWADYLFMRSNPKGMHREQWLHAAGCRRYFNAERDTVSYRIGGTYKIGEQAPSEADK